MSNPEYPQQEQPRVVDTSFDYKTDTPSRTKPDADSDSQMLRADHELLWTKELPSGALFAPRISSVGPNEYLIFTDVSGARHCYGSDAITSSYTTWVKPNMKPKSKALVDAIAGLNEDQKSVYLDTPYTIGSAMIWPLRSKDLPTINTARGLRMSVADRMDLTLECIRRHYTGEPGSPLADVTSAYADFFELFGRREHGFTGFVDFFHLQDLVTPDYKEIRFYLPFDNFERSGIPATTGQYVTYRNATLEFIAGRKRRMAEWVTKNHAEVEVRCPWWRPDKPEDGVHLI
ncbi:DUF6994 family protein [Pseudarthrobacter cellobiosi]|uniref:DUF6994 family protein n=1 Tax=Pseudarthrobacter cellobiosi TaxID=2953654 RepID=UPI00208FE62D|nr:hypothetical protein [Pseudarthrobacter sp. HLT1-5]MCO4254453.1 hypothetical protein [Pseudarthrobacter sp. HLT1-5]